MRKICLMLMSATMLILCGCFAITVSTSFKNSISELRYNCFTAEDKDFSVNFSSGIREDPYVFNLETEKMIDFGVLTAYKIDTKLKEHKARYIIEINDKKYNGEFEINPFDNSFVCDIKQVVAETDIIKITISADNKIYSYSLSNVFEKDDAKFNEIIKISEKEFKNVIKKNTKNGKFNAEVYVRIVSEIKQGKTYTFWVVNIVDASSNVSAIVISPKTREIVVKKIL